MSKISNSFSITGVIVNIKPTFHVSDKFSKREIVIKLDGEYPQFISLQFTKDKCSILDSYIEGEVVTVDFNLNGREWTKPTGEVVYFNSLDAWRISKYSNESIQTPAPAPASQQFDDVPF
jgi:hypothetical protein